MSKHSLHPSILREYDIRGIFEETLTIACAYHIGRAFSDLVFATGGERIILCRDGRLSSPVLRNAMAKGLMEGGSKVIDIGVGPTPMMYFATHELYADAGVMITGSHNPASHNGFKMTLGGVALTGREILELGDRIAGGNYYTGAGDLTKRDISEAYVERLLRDYKTEKTWRVAWDAGNGATGDIMTRLTKRLPGDHILLNAEIDGTFPSHHPDPSDEANMAQLKEVVLANKCDFGVAFDGDGDRVGIIDEKGRMIRGDEATLLLAGPVLRDLPGATIIGDVKSSRALFDGITKLGGKPLMWKTGHSLIKAKMKEVGSPFAGETSAHIFFGHRFYGHDDGLYGALRLFEALDCFGGSVGDFKDSLPQYHSTPEIKIDFSDNVKFDIVKTVRTLVAETKGVILDVDGVRVDYPNGWWLIRASNTQACLVMRCEADDKETLDALAKEALGLLTEAEKKVDKARGVTTLRSTVPTHI